MKKAAVPSILVAVVLLALGVTGEAQHPKKVPRIGYLTDSMRPQSDFEALQSALRKLGYVDGQNIAFALRFAEKPEQYAALAAGALAIRVHHQSQDGETDRSDNAAECAGESG